MSENELMPAEKPSARVRKEVTPAQLVTMAVQQGADVEKLRQLIALEKEWHAAQAKRAFAKAMAEFKKNPPEIVKDLVNKQFGSDYSSLGNLVNTTAAAMAPYGLNARWKPVKQTPDWIEIECILEHEEGHSESVVLGGPPDESQSREGKATKNRLQAIKSTITYLEGATFQAITGIVPRDRMINPDDDGNAAGTPPENNRPPEPRTKGREARTHVTEPMAGLLIRKLDAGNVSTAQFCQHFGVQSVDLLPFGRMDDALAWIRSHAKRG